MGILLCFRGQMYYFALKRSRGWTENKAEQNKLVILCRMTWMRFPLTLCPWCEIKKKKDFRAKSQHDTNRIKWWIKVLATRWYHKLLINICSSSLKSPLTVWLAQIQQAVKNNVLKVLYIFIPNVLILNKRALIAWLKGRKKNNSDIIAVIFFTNYLIFLQARSSAI